MPKFKITAPDGRVFNVTGDNAQGAYDALQQHIGGAAPQQAAPQVQTQPQPVPQQQEHAVPWYTPITSAPRNAWDVGAGLYNAVSHPVDTMNGIASLANGAIANIPGVTAINDWAVAHHLAPSYDKSREVQDQAIASAAGLNIKNNFDTPTHAWNTVATHPIDTLMIAAPGLGQLAKGAEVAGMAKTAGLLSKTAAAIDPVNIVAKPIEGISNLRATRAADKSLLGGAMSRQEVADLTDKMYGDIADKNIAFSGKDYAPFIDDVQKSFGTIGKEAAPVASSYRQSVINLLKGEGGKTLTDPFTGEKTVVPDTRSVPYNDLEEIRRNASAASSDMRLSDTERKVAGDLNSKIQGLYDTVPGLSESLNAAKEMARRNILAKQLEEMSRKSEWYTSGTESGLKNQINSFGKYKGKGLTPQEAEAMKGVARKEMVNGAISNAGGKLGQLVLGGIGASLGGIPGMLMAGGASIGARALSEAATLRALENAKRTVLLGKEGQKLLGVTKKGMSVNKNLVRGLLGIHAVSQ